MVPPLWAVYIWFAGIVVSIEIINRCINGRSLFSETPRCAKIDLPYQIVVGLDIKSRFCALALLAYIFIPLLTVVNLVQKNAWIIDAFMAPMIVLGWFAIISRQELKVVDFSSSGVKITPLNVFTGRALVEKEKTFSINEFKQVTLSIAGGPGTQGGGRSVFIRIGDNTNDEKLVFPPPRQYVADSFAKRLGEVFNLPVFLDTGMSKKRLEINDAPKT